jgi:hypothetical protein
MGLSTRPWNEAAKCTREDCQFSMTKKVLSVQIKESKNVNFFILHGLFIMSLYQLDKQSTKFTIWKYWKGCMKKLRQKQPEHFANNSWLLHHNTAPAHTALSVKKFLATNNCAGTPFLLTGSSP